MELFFSPNHYIIEEGDAALWIDRRSGVYTTKLGVNDDVHERTSVGPIYGYIGRLQLSPISEYLLVFIRQRNVVGELQGHPIYKVTGIECLPLESDCSIIVEPVPEVQYASGECKASTSSSPNHQVTPQRDGQTTAKAVKVKIPACPTAIPRKPNDKMERRLYDEFLKVLSEADSFYYSHEYDITNSVQRQQAMLKANESGTSGALQGRGLLQKPLWEQVDPRFFWNQYMVDSLIETKDKGLQRWVLPVLQGYIELSSCPLDREDASCSSNTTMQQPSGTLYVWIISRRSRYQAGTRYLRRGIDEDGNVANYVETEQIVLFKSHILSFVQIRGSIPVYWSQANGFRYRPPPKLERDEEDNFAAFKKHFSEEISRYGPVYALNLVEKSGKEKALGDAFLQYILRNNSSDVIYVTFDFHELCRGMRFDNISNLIEKLRVSDAFRSMNYCWVDHFGPVLLQSAVFRVNCIDCLDRTNVVQMYLAKEMLSLQLCKIGLIAPEIGIPGHLKKVLQTVWANNGDIISKQYAGTNALKGDFTRTGERRITGVMKDGMNSANRYYLNRFKDASRQAAIDLMLGVRKTVTEEDLTGNLSVPKEEKPENAAEHIKLIIEDLKTSVIPLDETMLGIWGLVNAKLNEPEALEIDIFLILSVENCYVVEYDFAMESIINCQKTPLVDLESLEIGFERLNQPTAFWNGLFGGRNINHSTVVVPNVRINYIQEDQLLYHVFRSTSVRFFNNVPVCIQHPEEILEAMRTVAEAIRAAVKGQGKTISITEADPTLARDASKASLPLMATNWVNNLFHASSSSSESSLNRFRPKNLIRGLTSSHRAVSPTDPDLIFGNGLGNPTGETTIISVLKDTSNLTEGESVINQSVDHHQLLLPPVYPDLIDLAVQSSVLQKPKLNISSDYILASCGILILSTGQRVSVSPITPEYNIHRKVSTECGVPSLTSLSELTIGSAGAAHDSIFSQQPSNSAPKVLNISHILRHRFSLPGNTLDIVADPLKPSTPEITISEDPTFYQYAGIQQKSPKIYSSLVGGLNVSGPSRRICRSSEDVNKFASVSSVMQNSVNAAFKVPSLFSFSKKENRASSQQDIFDSMNNMRGSHSESTLEGPFPNNASSQTKDLVFAPLGKLARGMQNLGANYFDPRKLRDSLKPVIRKDIPQDSIETRKKQCKTLIIDV